MGHRLTMANCECHNQMVGGPNIPNWDQTYQTVKFSNPTAVFTAEIRPLKIGPLRINNQPELDDGKILTGKPVIFDGKNPGFRLNFPSANPVISFSTSIFLRFSYGFPMFFCKIVIATNPLKQTPH